MKTTIRICIACCVAASAALAGTPVELTNAGFEQVGADGVPVGWSKHPNWHAERAGHNGSGGYVFECTDAKTRRGGRPGQAVRLEPGKRYLFSALVRADGLRTELQTPSQGVGLGRAMVDNVYLEEYEMQPVEGVYSDKYRREAVSGKAIFHAVLNTDQKANRSGTTPRTSRTSGPTARGGPCPARSSRGRTHAPQAFGWNWLYRKETAGMTCPTARELDNMCWQAVAGGANGLIGFAYQTVVNPHATKNNDDEFTREDVRTIAKGIKSHEDVLLSLPGPKVSGVPEELAVRTWDKGGAVLASHVRRHGELQAQRPPENHRSLSGEGIILPANSLLRGLPLKIWRRRR